VSFLDPQTIINAGYVVIAIVIFAECGLLIGFFLPGDSLLFTAGFLASQNSGVEIWT
jgi:membrane-associated protein